MLRTPYFLQCVSRSPSYLTCRITGRADFSKINIDASDETGDGGGELECVRDRVDRTDAAARTALMALCVAAFALLLTTSG